MRRTEPRPLVRFELFRIVSNCFDCSEFQLTRVGHAATDHAAAALMRSHASTQRLQVSGVPARPTHWDAHWELERRQHKQPHPLGDVVERGCAPPARSITTVMLRQLSV
jgi:hypothetical protein